MGRQRALLRAAFGKAVGEQASGVDDPWHDHHQQCARNGLGDRERQRYDVAAVQAAGLRLCAQDVTSAAVVRFYTRFLTQYRERRAEFETARGLARYQEGLERLSMSQQLAAAGILGQVAYIAAPVPFRSDPMTLWGKVGT